MRVAGKRQPVMVHLLANGPRAGRQTGLATMGPFTLETERRTGMGRWYVLSRYVLVEKGGNRERSKRKIFALNDAIAAKTGDKGGNRGAALEGR